MGWFRRSPNLRRPAAGIVPQPADQVHLAIMSLNRPDAPFCIRDADDEKADLVAEWKIDDRIVVAWFGPGYASGSVRTLMRLDPVRHEVRSVDQVRADAWKTGIGRFRGPTMRGRGQINRTYFGGQFGRKPDGGFGYVGEHRFSSKQVKEPVQKAITAAGWTWRGVSFGGL